MRKPRKVVQANRARMGRLDGGARVGTSAVAAVLVLFGLALLAVAVWQYRETRSFLDRNPTVVGVVIGLDPQPGSEGGTVYAPIVRFRPEGAEAFVEFTGNVASSPPSYDVGEEVGLSYDPEDPTDARLHGFFSLWGLVVIPGVVGGALTTAGALLLGGALRRSFAMKDPHIG